MPYDSLNNVPKFAVARSEPLTKGLVSRWQPQYIGPDAYSDGLNVDLEDLTRPSRRDGFSSALNITFSAITARASGIIYYNPSASANRKIIMPVDALNKTYYCTDVAASAGWSEVLSTGTVSIDPNGADCPMFVVNDFTVMVRPTGEPVAIDSSGVAHIGGGGSYSPPAAGVDGCAFQERAHILVRGAPNKLYYSKLLPTAAAFVQTGVTAGEWNRVDSLDDTSGYFPVAPNAGGLAMAVRPWAGTSLIVFLDSCIEEIIPGIANYAYGFNAERHTLEPNVGCGSRDSVAASGNEFFFVDQYAQVRSLGQTISGTQTGVIRKPLSEPIADYIPGKVNKQHIGKIRSVIFKDRLFVAFPYESSTEANVVAVYSLAHGIWEGIWRFPRAIGRWMICNLRGYGDELYFVDGSTATGPTGAVEAIKTYRLFDSSYEDNGEAIAFEWVSPAMDFGTPELEKVPEVLEVEVRAEGGTTISVDAQLDEDGAWNGVTTKALASGSGYWISYPQGYPLTNPQTAVLTRIKSTLKDLRGWGRCRFFRFRVREDTAGKQMQVAGWRVVTRPQPFLGVTET